MLIISFLLFQVARYNHKSLEYEFREKKKQKRKGGGGCVFIGPLKGGWPSEDAIFRIHHKGITHSIHIK